MANYMSLYLQYMDQNGIKYDVVKANRVRVAYAAENLDTIPIYVSFDEDGDPLVSFYCWEIANFKKNPAKGMLACNMLNAKYRWVKFYVDNDSDIICECDAFVSADSCGEECQNLVRRSVNIIDEAYPVFAKALED